MEQVLVKSQMDEFLEANLVELLKREYISTTIMLVKTLTIGLNIENVWKL
jgi:hypothetical protein